MVKKNFNKEFKTSLSKLKWSFKVTDLSRKKSMQVWVVAQLSLPLQLRMIMMMVLKVHRTLMPILKIEKDNLIIVKHLRQLDNQQILELEISHIAEKGYLHSLNCKWALM